MKKILILAATALFSMSLFAQSEVQPTDTIQKADSTKKIQFKLSANYNSGLNWYGRVDSLKSTGFFPLAELWLQDKFYINAAPIFVNNAVQNFDYAGTIATIGYQALSKNQKWLSHIYLLKPFYEESSELVQSVLQAQTGASLTYLTPIINFTGGGDINFLDSNTDFVVTAGIDKIIRIENKDKSVFVFDPGIYLYAGTQRFTHTYNKKNSNFLLFPGNGQQITEEVNQFSVLAYELMMPIIFLKNKWQVTATPAYVIPQNLLQVPNRPDLSERGENLFYATLSLKYSF